MPAAPPPDRLLRQRAALAEFALSTIGPVDLGETANEAVRALRDGIGAAQIGIVDRDQAPPPLPSCDSLALDACTALTLDDGRPSLVARADDQSDRLMLVIGDRPDAFDDDDCTFVGEVTAMLRGAHDCVRTHRSLVDSNARATAVLDTTIDAIITTDADRIIETVNLACERMFGYPAAELLGQDVSIILAEPFRTHYAEHLRTDPKTGGSGMAGRVREVAGRRRDGTSFPMEIAVSRVPLEDTIAYAGVIRDLSGRRRLEREVVEGIESDRQRLGHALHSQLGQELSGISMLAANLATSLDESAPAHAEAAREIATLVKGADRDARMIAHGLVQTTIPAGELQQAIGGMAARASRYFDLPIAVKASGDPSAISDDSATQGYRIAQEAITNAALHAHAQSVTVGLDWTPDGLVLSVTDDGDGFPEDEATEGALPTWGFGLRAMAYRAHAVGCVLDLSATAQGGTRVSCIIPLADPADS